MAAADEAELVHMVATARSIDDRPSAFRFPRGEGVGVDLPEKGIVLEIGKGRIVKEGSKVAILSFGARLKEVIKASDLLLAKGINPTIADARFAKPLDKNMIIDLVLNHDALITIEEGVIGGFGSHVQQLLLNEGIFDNGFKFRSMVFPDTFLDQDTPAQMYQEAAMSAHDIEMKVLEILGVASLKQSI
jgi:1-deoxy-D-xylulose-5-phosphate synthase